MNDFAHYRRNFLDKEMLLVLLKSQHTEMTEHHIYKKLASIEKISNNRTILEKIAAEELTHFEIWKKYTHIEVKPSLLKVRLYYLISLAFGVTFGIKLMERKEKNSQKNYQKIAKEIPEAVQIEAEENDHEHKLIGLISEERLSYVGSIVLGLNDALVELTGALAGLSLALQNTKMVAMAGMITGIAASLSMAASEYLSTKSEKSDKSPLKAAVYTGIAYVFTVTALIMPFVFIPHPLIALGLTLTIVIVIIAMFTFYISVAMGHPFKKRFFEMAGISLGVAAISFFIGLVIRRYWNIEM
jgi:VIT1/CCC1 family predicted Fe2+/Mn2+ transporter